MVFLQLIGLIGGNSHQQRTGKIHQGQKVISATKAGNYPIGFRTVKDLEG